MRMTMLDIENTDKFFEMVERCTGPVMVHAAGRSEDIRGNAFLRELLAGAGTDGKIARLELNVEADRDFTVLCRYMMEAGA